jgi:hypothetical protein
MVMAYFHPYCPLGIRRNKPRPLTAQEQADFNRMKRKGPKVFNGTTPTDNDAGIIQVNKTTYRGVPVTFVHKRTANNRVMIDGYTMGMVCPGRPSTLRFINNFLAATHTERIANIGSNTNVNANTRVQRAFEAAKLKGLTTTYNDFSNGTTVAAFRRRGLIHKLEV